MNSALPPSPQHPRTRSANAIAWRVSAMAFAGGISGGVVFPILPALGERMGLSAFMIGVILAANRVVRMGVNPVTGSLTDRFGGREVIAAGLFIEGLGSLGYITALHTGMPTLWFLIGRIIWGVGSSLLFVGAISAVLRMGAAHERGRLVSRTRSAISSGVPGGLVLGGLLTDLVNADAAFIVATALSVIGAIAALALVPRRRHLPGETGESKAPAHKPHLLHDWLLIVRERRLIPIWFYTALAFFSYGGVLMATLVLLIDHRHTLVPGLNAEGSAGLLMCAMVLSYAGISMWIGRHIDAPGRRTSTLLPGLAGLIVGCCICAFAYDLGWLIPGLALIGAGAGAVTIPLLTVLGDLVAIERRGRATGLYQVAADTGAAAGAILGLVLGARFGFKATYLGLGATFLLSLPLAFSLIAAERRAIARRTRAADRCRMETTEEDAR